MMNDLLERLSDWIASPTGRWAAPVVSSVLLVAGIALILTSLGGGTPAPTPTPAIAAAGMTEDLAAAMDVARAYLVDQSPNSYDGFTASAAQRLAPKIQWSVAEEPADGQIAIRVSGKTGIVLVGKQGAAYACISDTNADEEASRGKVNAQKPEECTGGW